MKNGKIIKQVRTYICVLFVLLCVGFALAFTTNKLKAETNIYQDINILEKNYVVDYSAPSNYNANGITIINNQDGTFTLSGTTTAVVAYRIPLTIPNDKPYCYDYEPGITNTSIPSNCGILYQVFEFKTDTKELLGGYNQHGPTLTLRVSSNDSYLNFSSNIGYWGNSINDNVLRYVRLATTSDLRPSIGYDKWIEIYIGQSVNVDNLTILPVIFDNISYAIGNNVGPGRGPQAIFEYINSFVGPTPNTDVYYATTKPQAGYYIYQKVNEQLGVDLLPAIRYTLTVGETILERDITIDLGNNNIDVLKLTAPNGNVYRVYYDNITASNTKDSYFVEDNGTTTILQNADGSGDINQTGLDALILALQHALTYNAVITTADHYIFNLCSKLYVFDTDFGYAKGVQEGSANYQPGQPGYTSIYNAGKDYGEQQKDTYYNNYYGGSNGIGGAGYTSIYNAGKEAGARITTNWLYEILNTIVVVFGLELLPGIKLGYIVGAPVVISTIWFIIRQFSGGKNE